MGDADDVENPDARAIGEARPDVRNHLQIAQNLSMKGASPSLTSFRAEELDG
jgi:hypothetical protein